MPVAKNPSETMCFACGKDNPIGLHIEFDITGNIPYAQGLVAHTARCEIRYRQPLRKGQTILLKGWTEKLKGRLMVLRGEARLKSDNELIAECTASFLVEK